MSEANQQPSDLIQSLVRPHDVDGKGSSEAQRTQSQGVRPELPLLPCPWCGKQPIILRAFGNDSLRSVACVNACPCRPSTAYVAMDDAVEAWNTRAWQPAKTAPPDDEAETDAARPA